MERNFTKLPMDWVDRIFERMECIYKDRWISLVGNESRRSILKTMWSTGLSGLDATAIRRALLMCESYPYSAIPTHIEFYHYAKGIRLPDKRRAPTPIKNANPEIAKQYLSEIQTKLKSPRSST